MHAFWMFRTTGSFRCEACTCSTARRLEGAGGGNQQHVSSQQLHVLGNSGTSPEHEHSAIPDFPNLCKPSHESCCSSIPPRPRGAGYGRTSTRFSPRVGYMFCATPRISVFSSEIQLEGTHTRKHAEQLQGGPCGAVLPTCWSLAGSGSRLACLSLRHRFSASVLSSRSVPPLPRPLPILSPCPCAVTPHLLSPGVGAKAPFGSG